MRFPKKPAYMRRFKKVLLRELGSAYPIPPDDWTTAEYWFNMRKPADEAAQELAAGRKVALQGASRSSCKAWHDDDGKFRCEPCVPTAVAQTVKAAVDGGSSHGTVYHWERVLGNFHTLQDVRPVLFTWETL